MAIYKGSECELTGADDFIGFLKSLGPNIEKRMLDQSVSAAVKQGLATPIKKKIRSVVKRRTGNLLKGVKTSKVSGAPKGNYRVFMGPPAFHAHLIEGGTVAKRPAVKKRASRIHRVVKFKTGTFRMVTQTGGIKPTPFFKPAVQENKMKAGEILSEQLKKRIAAYIVPKRKTKKR